MKELLDLPPSPAAFLSGLPLTEADASGRLQALDIYEIIDSAPEKAYDDIARLAAYVCGAPVAVISFFSRDGRWTKSRYGNATASGQSLNLPAESGPAECALHEPGQVLQLSDLPGDPQFARLGLKTSKLKFYAAVPLCTPAGLLLGSLAVLDRRTRHLTQEQLAAMETLARQVMELLEMRRTLIGLSGANAQLGRQNLTDALTGIPNRRAYDQKLAEEATRSRRTGAPLSLLLADIDHFKDYNDTYGHPAGDAALQSVARALLAGLRPYDFLARYGGEEFAIILPATDLTDAIAVAERARGAVAASEFSHRRLTISVGVSRLDAESGPRAMVQAADIGLYRAKAAGRNKVVVGKLNDRSPVGSAIP